MASYTFLGGRLPADVSPTLLFLKGQAYDSFRQEPFNTDEPFDTKSSRPSFLETVADEVQSVNRDHYAARHQRFAEACKSLGAEPPVVLKTHWRLVSGWATNPTLEIGMTLDPLLGFPFVPGSAVKGLLHHHAEMKLVQDPGSVPKPECDTLPEQPPEELEKGIERALLIRGLFGSLSARREKESDQPEAPHDRLRAWLALAKGAKEEPGELPTSWHQPIEDLELLCDGPATGGLVTCFDAVPAPNVFVGASPRLLEMDVLTPHLENGPRPLLFLAVRAEAPFELRFRLDGLPTMDGDPADEADKADEEEKLRRRVFCGTPRKELVAKIHAWLKEALEERGSGAKTSAGYGYMVPLSQKLGPPESSEQKVVIPPKNGDKGNGKKNLPSAKKSAAGLLPEGLDPGRLADRLDQLIGNKLDSETHKEVALRVEEIYSAVLAKWRNKKKPTIIARLQAFGLDRPAEDEEANE